MSVVYNNSNGALMSVVYNSNALMSVVYNSNECSS